MPNISSDHLKNSTITLKKIDYLIISRLFDPNDLRCVQKSTKLGQKLIFKRESYQRKYVFPYQIIHCKFTASSSQNGVVQNNVPRNLHANNHCKNNFSFP